MSNRKLRTMTIAATLLHEARGLNARARRRKRPAPMTISTPPGKLHPWTGGSKSRRPAPGATGGGL
jgi:hypothetical protein